jgi:transglutaminase-like putative cysteine protease
VIYDIRQTTSYAYAATVTHARHALRLMPALRDGQRVHAAVLDIDPKPARSVEASDFFGNRITLIELAEPHATLTMKLSARISVETPAACDPANTPAWETVRAAAFESADLDPLSPVHFIHPSRQVSLDPEIREYARESFPAGRPVLAGAADLMNRVKHDFTYEPGATTVTTTPSMSFALRRGVCQDFAHIMISGLRGLGLPAAYVSGYLRTIPRAGEKRLEGADAMHAWVMIWCGGDTGWCGIDPTNALIVADDHVALAVGRDYADVAPIDGVVFSSGTQQLKVAVDVVPVG